MGASQSKSNDELLLEAVKAGDIDTVVALHRDGASLELPDKHGRTALLIACSRGELSEMALTLLELGANIKAYQPGQRGGFPLHLAARSGLEEVTSRLLSLGASPLTVNDDLLSPLEIARSRGHAKVVRVLEDRLCLFSGKLRQLPSSGMPFVSQKVWAVVLPTKTASVFEIAIYAAPAVGFFNAVGNSTDVRSFSRPRRTVQLGRTTVVERPDLSHKDPVLHIVDRSRRRVYRFCSGKKGDKGQLEKLFKACQGNYRLETCM